MPNLRAYAERLRMNCIYAASEARGLQAIFDEAPQSGVHDEDMKEAKASVAQLVKMMDSLAKAQIEIEDAYHECYKRVKENEK